MEPMNSVSDLQQNMPAIGMDYITNSVVFGNYAWQVMPSPTGEVSDTYATIPYVSLNSLIYMQQILAPTLPTNTTSGSTTGQQNITGALTVTDSSGNIVAQISSGTLPSTNGAASTTQASS